jgi:hypothetical protein
MGELIEISTANGPILFDADELPSGPAPVARRGTNLVAHFDDQLEAQLERARTTARAAIDAFRTLGPDEVTLEFGLRLDAEAGIVVARTTGSVHFLISAKWTADGDGSDD